jgi:hypothetical protein
MPTGSFADRVRRWERLAQTLATNAPDLPGVADDLKKMQDLLQRTKDMQRQEDANQAQFRDTITLRQALDKEGEDLRSRLMHSLKGRFGFKNDKLYEFGMRPVKARRTKKAAPPDGSGGKPEPPPETPGEAHRHPPHGAGG